MTEFRQVVIIIISIFVLIHSIILIFLNFYKVNWFEIMKRMTSTIVGVCLYFIFTELETGKYLYRIFTVDEIFGLPSIYLINFIIPLLFGYFTLGLFVYVIELSRNQSSYIYFLFITSSLINLMAAHVLSVSLFCDKYPIKIILTEVSFIVGIAIYFIFNVSKDKIFVATKDNMRKNENGITE